ncbi:hypothetical protein [[Clostridium] colinum]|uniref:hypothetical protein n=1 Tax=[Clostridium] colinum TaxID=36835 RepID=UPI002025209F|nr:hypothetical protein [[Clostridium] colinum]
MKYFIIEKDKKFYSSPQFKSWHQDINFLPESRHYSLEKRKAFFIKDSEFLFWTDIISSPVFLISEKVKEVVKLYDNKLKMKQIILIEPKIAEMGVYYLPIFEEIYCLAGKDDIDSKEIAEKIILKREKIKDKPIFKIGGFNKRYIVARMDLVESILKREVKGINLIEMKVL